MSLINKTSSVLFWSICPPLCGRQPRCRSVNVLHPYSHTRHCSFIVFKLWQHKALQEGVTGFHPLFQLHFPWVHIFSPLSNPSSRDLISSSWEFAKAFQQISHREQALDDFLISWENEESENFLRKWGKWVFWFGWGFLGFVFGFF